MKTAGINLQLTLGQRVLWFARFTEHDRISGTVLETRERHTGVIQSLEIAPDMDGGRDSIVAVVLLDEPLKHPAIELSDGTRLNESRTYRVTAGAHELLPYSDLDEILDALRELTFAAENAGPASPHLATALLLANRVLDRHAPKKPQPIPAAEPAPVTT